MRSKLCLLTAFAAASFSALPNLPAHDTFAAEKTIAQPRMEVVFVLDTTGSMSGMIAGAKQKVWAIANKLKSAQPTPEIRFGLVGYRDRGDAYVTKVFGLTGNLDEVYPHLYGFEANGGGDEPESGNEALYKAVRDLQWSTSPDVLRVIFLVGDARPHMDYQDDVKYQVTCRLANEKGILINALQCGRLDGTEAVWRDIAGKTNGSYAAILQDGGSIKIETPYDQEIIRLNLELNATIILRGIYTYLAMLVLIGLSTDTFRRHPLLMWSTAGFIVAGILFRSSLIAGKGDLVVDVLNGRQKIESIDVKQLDPKLQALPAPARNEIIAEQVEKRRALQAELASVVAKRDAVVAEKLKAMEGKEGVLELNAFEVLESQAKDKGYKFEKKP